MAYAARRSFPPEKPIYLLGEIIHNPEVNDQIRHMGIRTISNKPNDAELAMLQREDVVIIPAFGTEVATRRKLEEKARSEAPQGIIAFAAEIPESDFGDMLRGTKNTRPFLVAVDGVTDPGNLGAVMRTAELAGATGIVIPKHRSARLSPAAMKAAAGAAEWLPVAQAAGLPAFLDDLCGGALDVDAITATELSGFHLRLDMSDTLVVAVSQSGTTTDTNRTVDLARGRGASVLAIVNRRGGWMIVVSGFFEPLFYLLSIRVGFGSLVGDVKVGGRLMSYAEFVAPALFASSAMNGAVYEATNVFFKLKYEKTYDAVLLGKAYPVLLQWQQLGMNSGYDDMLLSLVHTGGWQAAQSVADNIRPFLNAGNVGRFEQVARELQPGARQQSLLRALRDYQLQRQGG